jgi:hypothetical protein
MSEMTGMSEQEHPRGDEEPTTDGAGAAAPQSTDGGPGSHTEDGTGGESNDSGSGGIPEEAGEGS